MLVPKIVPMGCHCSDPPDWGVVKVQLAVNRRCNGGCGTNIILRDNGRYEFICQWQNGRQYEGKFPKRMKIGTARARMGATVVGGGDLLPPLF